MHAGETSNKGETLFSNSLHFSLATVREINKFRREKSVDIIVVVPKGDQGPLLFRFLSFFFFPMNHALTVVIVEWPPLQHTVAAAEQIDIFLLQPISGYSIASNIHITYVRSWDFPFVITASCSRMLNATSTPRNSRYTALSAVNKLTFLSDICNVSYWKENRILSRKVEFYSVAEHDVS